MPFPNLFLLGTTTLAVFIFSVPVHSAVPPVLPFNLNDLTGITTDRTNYCGQCNSNVAYTYEQCSYYHLCAASRWCINPKEKRSCTYASGEECRCEPLYLQPCLRAEHCSLPYETCAYLPNSKPYCYSTAVVQANSSFNYFTYNPSCCGDPSQSPGPSLYPTPSSDSSSYPYPSESSYPKTSETPVTLPPPVKSEHPYPSTTYDPPSPSAFPPAYSPYPSPSTFKLTVVPKPSLYPSPNPGSSPDPYPSPSPSPGGLAGDPCDPSAPKPCKEYRKCSVPKACATSVCKPECELSTPCKCTSDCFDGEICVSAAHDDKARYCYSPFRAVNVSWVQVHHCADSGMTGDGCIDDSYCKDGRRCVQGGRSECIRGLSQCGLDRPKCDDKEPFDCFCSGVKFCSCTEGCESSEVCCHTAYGNICLSRNSASKNVSILQCPVTITTNTSSGSVTQYPAPSGSLYAVGDPLGLSGEPRQPSPSANSQSQPTTSSGTGGSGTNTNGGNGGSTSVEPVSTVCVAVDELIPHLSTDKLVYGNKHPRGAVLCDTMGSCATPGHMVQYKDEVMMMSSYCAKTSCTKRVVHVNSPKFQRRLLIPARTDGLYYTAFAAKYASRTEEMLLKTAVHIGL